ncbi:MAG: hypothetical protein M3478_07585 [Planctomycetota bacterium]|nr:hypothetical protein [Planctomycetota bacterium]
MEARLALDTIARRLSQMENVSGEGAMTLVDANGDSVRLDAAFALAPPERARVRGWKFGQAVLDLTILPDSVWLYSPRKGCAESAAGNTSRALRQWLGLLAGRIDGPGASIETTSTQIIVTRAIKDGQSLVCYIDRRTLTPRRYVVTDHGTGARFSLVLDRYKTLGDTVWPSRVQARDESRRVTFEMRHVEMNVAPPSAFRPPARAERLP